MLAAVVGVLAVVLAAPPRGLPPLVSRTQPDLRAPLSRTPPPPEQRFVKFQGMKPLDSVRLPPMQM